MRHADRAPMGGNPQGCDGDGSDDRWNGLRTLIRARLLVATLALPVGVLLHPDGVRESWGVLGWSLLAVGGVTLASWFGVRFRRWINVQSYAQVGADLLLVTFIASATGGRDSQFVLFYALVVITGGLLNRLVGGLLAAAAACAAFMALPWIAGGFPPPTPSSIEMVLTPSGMVIAYLAMMGVLAGTLGQRVRRTHDDLKRTARELDRVRVDNDAILRHLTTGVLTVDARETVAYLNPAGEQVLGVRQTETRDRPLAEALPERLAPLCALVAETLARRSPRARAELMVKSLAGRWLPLGISTSLLMHEGRITGVVAVFQDLTEVREMERRARRNETLAELGALSARIAHELRNGLNPISGSVECLQRELKLSGENAVLFGLIATECNRLNRFVSDLLNYSREREMALEPLDLEENLVELCDAIALDPRKGDRVSIELRRVGRPAAFHGDREQIRQVWVNLAVNAFEAMKDGGTLVIQWREGEQEQLIVEFIDSGPGIAAEDLPRVGQPFYTTKVGGTGLGVAIAQRIVERHGGTLTLESQVGRGTTARVVLSCSSGRVAQAA